jgi:hypothetical protein
MSFNKRLCTRIEREADERSGVKRDGEPFLWIPCIYSGD